MRYRATIAVDVFADTKEEAEKRVQDIVLGLPNSFQMAIFRLPHGSKISLVSEKPTHQG